MGQLPIIRFRYLWYGISGVLIAGSIISLLFFGLKFGIDFTGGSLLEVAYTGERPSIERVHETLIPLELGEVVAQPTGEKGLLLRFKNVDEAKHQAILDALKTLGELEERRFTTIGPTIGEELKRKALLALGLATLGIMVYIAWAFRRVSKPIPSWQYGLITALVALFHDSLIPLGVFAALGNFFGWEVNIPFVAAMLTVLGFSVHDTIVVFDRTRENVRKADRQTPFSDVVNMSVNQTLGRSLTTSFTVLLVTFAIYFFAGEALHSFSFVMIVGIALGVYSSIFVASPLLVDFQRLRLPRFRRR